MSLTTATGRWLFSFIFIASAVNKYVHRPSLVLVVVATARSVVVVADVV